MRIADILRQLADNIDGHAPGGTPDPAIQNKAPAAIPTGQNIVIDVGSEEDKPSPNGQTASGNDKEPADLFIPPLQQKQELLKKAVGVENIYDDGTATDQMEQEDEESPEEYDIVDRIKQLSGVPVAAIQELGNDEVFDD